MTEVPTEPDVGLRLVSVGATATMVKLKPLLGCPPTVTTTFPVLAPVGTGATTLVALQIVGVAIVPLNVTVLVPWVAPKFVPAIVTELPTGPNIGLILAMAGAACLIVIVALPDLIGSATEVAVRITVGGLGTVEGAI